MCSVLILLSTFNGSKFLREQLDSLYAQKDVEIHILVRDDGSKDDTVSILEEYKQKYGRMTILAQSNIGCARSFYYLINYAVTEMPRFDYYAFCDQDDVWFEYKLYTSCRNIESKSKTPELFFAPAVPVDSTLKPLKPSTKRVVNCVGANIASSHSLGCTQVFNRALLEKTCLINNYTECHNEPETYYPLHDAWTALVAYSLGRVVVGEAPVMFYRQHGGNVVGAGQSGIRNLTAKIRRNINGSQKKSKKCKILVELMHEDIPMVNRKLIELCATYDQSLFRRIRLAFNKELYHYGIHDNIGIFIVILLKQF